jgi:hypothetical protein
MVGATGLEPVKLRPSLCQTIASRFISSQDIEVVAACCSLFGQDVIRMLSRRLRTECCGYRVRPPMYQEAGVRRSPGTSLTQELHAASIGYIEAMPAHLGNDKMMRTTAVADMFRVIGSLRRKTSGCGRVPPDFSSRQSLTTFRYRRTTAPRCRLHNVSRGPTRLCL